MRLSLFMAVPIAIVILLSTGCECDAESNAELCGDFTCGSTTLFDRCGDQREIECGSCGVGEDCQDNQCVCEPEDDEMLCANIGAGCGGVNLIDRCGSPRSIECGGCTQPETCIEGMCRCETAESSEQLCASDGLQCGEATVSDSCGEERPVDCGGCGTAEQCEGNLCGCAGESDQALCAASEGACGLSQLTDRCGDTRQVECEACIEGYSTLGAVRNAATGDLIEGAQVRIYEWPPPGGTHYSWFWTEGFRLGDADVQLITTEEVSGVNFELTEDGGLCSDEVQESSLETEQRYRFYITSPGYQTGVFYRKHEGFRSEDCPSSCPAAASSGCHRMDFELWPEDMDHAHYPTLLIDTRDLEDYEWQCVLMPDDSPQEELMGLRVRLGAANVGKGPLHLEASSGNGGEGEILQHIAWSDGSRQSEVVESAAFELHPEHDHIHFLNWFRMSLVEPTEECLDVDNRPGSCVTDDGVKISYCLYDLDSFDGDVMSLYGGMSALFLNPPTCDSTEQGITQGWKDTYGKRLPGQVIILGPPSLVSSFGEQWIEAEVDPDKVLNQEDDSNNLARLLVEAPSQAAALCTPGLALDCSGPEAGFDAEQRRQCGDYLDWVDP